MFDFFNVKLQIVNLSLSRIQSGVLFLQKTCDQEKYADPEVGMLFKNYDEVETFLNNYTQQSKQIFIEGKTKPEGSSNIKKKLKIRIKYYEINYVCKHGLRIKHKPKQKIRKER